MENRYPFLAFWKKRGLNKFPSIPPERFLQILTEPHLKKGREVHRENYFTSPTVVALSPEDARLEEEITFQEEFKPMLERLVWERFLEWPEEQKEKIFNEHLNARRRIVLNGEVREQVEADLSNSLLPDTKGGPAFHTKAQKIILKCIFTELQECIKEIRRELDISSRDLTEDPYKSTLEDIKEKFPEINKIFIDEEIPLLFQKSSVAETAREIIVSRLQKSPNIRHHISARTLKDILSKI